MYEQEFGLDERARGVASAIAEPFQLVGLVLGVANHHPQVPQRHERPAEVPRPRRRRHAVCCRSASRCRRTCGSPSLFNCAISAVGAAIFPASWLRWRWPSRRGHGQRASRSPRCGSFPGWSVLPLIGWISTDVGIRWGMLVMVPLFIIGSAHPGQRVGRDQRRHRPGVAGGDGAQRAAVSTAPRREPTCCWSAVFGRLRPSAGAVRGRHRRREGEIVALLGTNGAGKSTLLKAISGVVEADRGAVVIDGRDITHAPPNEIAALGISQMPGGQGVFGSLTVGENLRAGRLDSATPCRRCRGRDRGSVRDVPGAARAHRRRRGRHVAAGSSRCWRWAWPSSPGHVCC